MGRSIQLFAAVLLIVLLFSACGGAASSSSVQAQGPVITSGEKTGSGAELAFLCLTQDLEDSNAQAVWSTLSRFAGEQGFTASTYKAEDGGEKALDTLELAARGGARLVVVMGGVLQDKATWAQITYPELDFVFLSTVPGEETAGFRLNKNAAAVGYSPEQGGWLAGYAAVYEGARALGYFESDDPLAQRYALGFLLGAEAAATAKNLTAGSVEAYPISAFLPEGNDASGDSSASSLPPSQNSGEDATQEDTQLKERIAALYASGVEVVFANLPEAQDEVLAAARAAKARMEGLGLTLPLAGGTAIASVQSDPRGVLQSLLESWKNGLFPGGETVYGTVADGDVSLATDPSLMTHFTETRYNAVVQRFQTGPLAAEIRNKTAPDLEGHLPGPEELGLSCVVVIRPGNPAQSASVSLPPEGSPASSGAPPEDTTASSLPESASA